MQLALKSGPNGRAQSTIPAFSKIGSGRAGGRASEMQNPPLKSEKKRRIAKRKPDFLLDVRARASCTNPSRSIGHREVNAEAVSGRFPTYLGLGVYGHGPCLHSLHCRCVLGLVGSTTGERALLERQKVKYGSPDIE